MPRKKPTRAKGLGREARKANQDWRHYHLRRWKICYLGIAPFICIAGWLVAMIGATEAPVNWLWTAGGVSVAAAGLAFQIYSARRHRDLKDGNDPGNFTLPWSVWERFPFRGREGGSK